MARLPILVAPDPLLKRKARPVAVVDAEIRTLLADMLETMYAAPGIGLAAPQVGVDLAAIVVDVAKEGETPEPFCMVNPEVLWCSPDLQLYEEGCLSLPDQFAEVERPARIRVRYQDETGTSQTLEAAGLLAVCIQHEIDHLGGTLFVDHISRLKRDMILRKLQKWKRDRAEADEPVTA